MREGYGRHAPPSVDTPVMQTHELRILRLAAGSRVVVSVLCVATALLVTPYDTSSAVDGPLTAFAHWDGVYFARIAQFGYEFEHAHAFFPLYPLVVRLLSHAIPLSSHATSIVISGWLVSNISFVLAALFLYRLGRLVLHDDQVARRAAYLFCIAPSGVFMSAVYTESFMCLCSFAGMFYLERHKRSHRPLDLLLCAMLFGCASAIRSNGALLSLFIAWHRLTVSPWPLSCPTRFLGFWMATALLGIVAVGPQVLYFANAMTTFCPSLFGAASAVSADRPWCSSAIPNVSAMYMFIQKEYWNVGLFRYYEWKQLPNFVLAAPMLLLSGHGLATHFWSRFARPSKPKALLPPRATTYYVHWLFLTVNALLVVHIQVTTRLLCACPPVFWAPAAYLMEPSRPAALSRLGRVVLAYFLLFNVLGIGLFSSFYPWT